MSNGGKISTDGGQGLGQNPFAALSAAGLPPKTGDRKPDTGVSRPESGNRKPDTGGAAKPVKNRGRVDIRRETGGRGGKTVTVADGFVGIGEPEKDQLAKKIRSACGCGGTVKDGAIVIQGDQRETVARILGEAGFKAVFAGG
ncbi:translation initiation factor [Horticoccus sp. 23ND18S-11]|uniref:translation initiation factor n=1 Tax=Horticoccus sp. 23ND18S-11 TaxID=3391832 RepID=UPI0039C8F645